jgi:hypothetical protein
LIEVAELANAPESRKGISVSNNLLGQSGPTWDRYLETGALGHVGSNPTLDHRAS